ncbi:anti-sigma factor [Bacteroidia bacterium]|nr:anti-sigma factor [Bacteroidia bacterium]
MEKKYIAKIITQFIRHRHLPETEEKIQRWLIDEEFVSEKNQLLEDYWDSLPAEVNKKTYASLASVKAKIKMDDTRKTIPLRRQLLRIAAVLIPILMMAGGYFYFQTIHPNESIVKVSVPYGESRQVTLPDGSSVWINAGSEIRYEAGFDNRNRHIKLSGEAYFSVVKDTARPFIVETDKLTVEALGTAFNVKSYSDEDNTIATLNSGKIKVVTKNKQSQILVPKQQITYNKRRNSLQLSEVDAENSSDWRNGNLVFEGVSLQDIVLGIERRFNVTIETDKAMSLTDHYSVKYVNKESLEEMLAILKDISGYTFQITNNKVK